MTPCASSTTPLRGVLWQPRNNKPTRPAATAAAAVRPMLVLVIAPPCAVRRRVKREPRRDYFGCGSIGTGGGGTGVPAVPSATVSFPAPGGGTTISGGAPGRGGRTPRAFQAIPSLVVTVPPTTLLKRTRK